MRNERNGNEQGRGGRGYGYGKRPPRREWEYEETRDEPESLEYLAMKEMLTAYYRQGVRISLNGVRMPASRIARICAVREEGSYMGDFIVDENGRLKEVRFDRIDRR